MAHALALVLSSIRHGLVSHDEWLKTPNVGSMHVIDSLSTGKGFSNSLRSEADERAF